MRMNAKWYKVLWLGELRHQHCHHKKRKISRQGRHWNSEGLFWGVFAPFVVNRIGGFELVGFLLSVRRVNEIPIASTSQLLGVKEPVWSTAVLKTLGRARWVVR